MNKQIEITQKCPLFENGQLVNQGWAKQMLWEYDKKNIPAKPFTLKQWDFYQVRVDDNISIQLAIVDVGYTLKAQAVIVDTKNNRTIPMSIYQRIINDVLMSNHPYEKGTIEVKEKGFSIRFDTLDTHKRLRLKTITKKNERIECDIYLTNEGHDAFAALIPFEKKNEFFLTNKESIFDVSGSIIINGEKKHFSKATAVMDWGRGIWPLSVQWFWGTGAGYIGNNNRFSFNLGYGFGKYDYSNDNIYFIDGKPVKLASTRVDQDVYQPMKPIKIYDESEQFSITLNPFFEHKDVTKAGPLEVNYKQYQALAEGFVQKGSKKIKFDNFPVFYEQVKNRW